MGRTQPPFKGVLDMILFLAGGLRWTTFIVVLGGTWGAFPVPQDRPSGIAASKVDLLAITAEGQAERSADGRPKVADDLLRRMKDVSIEEAWDVLRQRGYEHQFVDGWQMIHPDRPFVGRALTAAYLPSRPDLVDRIMQTGKAEGRIGPSNS